MIRDVEGEDGQETMGQQLSSRPAIGIETTWRDHASCRFANLDLFFPAGSRPSPKPAKSNSGACDSPLKPIKMRVSGAGRPTPNDENCAEPGSPTAATKAR